MARLQEGESKTSYTSLIEDSHGTAQVYPEDKFRIAKTLQDNQHIVGMTDDGVNDAPALANTVIGAILGFILLTTFLINNPLKVYLINKLKDSREASSID